MSSLADRIKVARGHPWMVAHDVANGDEDSSYGAVQNGRRKYSGDDSDSHRGLPPSMPDDVNLSIQFLLNCGTGIAGSCHGGSATGAYDYIKNVAGYVPYDTCQPYMACSADSSEGFCPFIAGAGDCASDQRSICKTCIGEAGIRGGGCFAVDRFPNATIAEYGTYHNDTHGIMAEIYARGPVKASVSAGPLKDYRGGIISDPSYRDLKHNHGVSIVGWGINDDGRQHWIVRNR